MAIVILLTQSSEFVYLCKKMCEYRFGHIEITTVSSNFAEELSGIFVKSISEGSAADLCKKIQVNDRIVEVDGRSLQGYTNHQAVEVLRSTGQTVRLCLERYLRGPKFEQLQQAIAASELKPATPTSPSAASLPRFPVSTVRIEIPSKLISSVRLCQSFAFLGWRIHGGNRDGGRVAHNR